MRIFCILAVFLFVPLSLSANLITVDPDSFAAGTDISAASPYATLSSVGGATGLNGKVYACTDPLASTGSNVFANNLSTPGQWLNKSSGGYALRVDFLAPTNYVAIDCIGDGGFDYGTMDIYNSSGTFITSVISPSMLSSGQVYTAQIQRADADIAYIVAGGMGILSSVHLDHLVFQIPEPATILLSLGMLALRPGKK